MFSFEEVEEEEEVEVEVILPDISDRSDSVAIIKVPGCTEYDSKNYNPEANNDDGSCIPWVSCSALYLSAYSSPHYIYQPFVSASVNRALTSKLRRYLPSLEPEYL